MKRTRMKTCLEYDGENDVCGIAFKIEGPNAVYFRIVDIPFNEMNKIIEKHDKEFGEIARMRQNLGETPI